METLIKNYLGGILLLIGFYLAEHNQFTWQGTVLMTLPGWIILGGWNDCFRNRVRKIQVIKGLDVKQ
jgi:cystathionine beta-lyase family protein involved in aluminum resistance